MPVASLILSQPSPATAKAPPQAAKLLAGGEHAIAVELADLLYDSPWPVATNLVVTLATIGVLSFAFQSLIFLGWGISIAGICVVRILLWRLYHRHRLQADFEPQAWIRRFTYFAAATGCQWGSLATAVALLSSANADLFVPIIIAGLAGGIASDYTPHVPVVDAFIWPVVLPLIIVTFAVGDAPHIALSLLYFVFVVNLSLMARRSFRTLVHKLREKAEKEQLVTRLFEANRRAETALRAKSEFLANMSHELRTPLNAVIGFSEIISDEILGPIGNRKYLEYAHDLHASGQHLLQLINDILDLTKIGAGKLELRRGDGGYLRADRRLRPHDGASRQVAGIDAVAECGAGRRFAARRFPPAPPGDAQFAEQQRQIHPAGRFRRGALLDRGGAAGRRGARHRRRHRRGRPAAGARAVRPGR